MSARKFEVGDVVRVTELFVVRELDYDENGDLQMVGLAHPFNPDYPLDTDQIVLFAYPEDVVPAAAVRLVPPPP